MPGSKTLTDSKRIVTFAKNVILCAEIKEISIFDLEDILDLKSGTINNWQKGGRAISEDTLTLVADYFGVKYIDLLGTSGPEESRRAILAKLLEQECDSGTNIRNLGRHKDAVDVNEILSKPLRQTRKANPDKRVRPANASLTSNELVWDETGTIAYIGEHVFDLKKKR